MAEKKDITIYDIANKLNLSSSTISRALQDHISISQSTKKKVRQAAKELGYRPNALAASLRNNTTKNIGVLISRINRPFISSLITGIEMVAQKKGYNVIISQSHDFYDDEVKMAKALYDSRICGIICSLSMETKTTDHFNQFIDKKIPLVFVDRVPKEFNTYRVMIDNYRAAYKATSHLIEQGCTKIAHFAGAQHINIYSERKRGYMDALKEHDLEINKDYIISFNTLSYNEGAQISKKLLSSKNPPDGIFSSNDTAAIAAIKCAKNMGVSIPQDLAIIGFNDDPMASIIDPGLSSVTHPAIKMGEISAKKIIDHLKVNKNNDDEIMEITFLNTEIVVRESSKRK